MPFNSETARHAALIRWSRHDPHEQGLRGQEGLRRKFRREVLAADPDLVDESEIARRVDCLRRAHIRKMVIKRLENQRKRSGTAS